MSVSKIARQYLIGRAGLTEVLNGRRAGGPTWRKLRKILTAEEYDCAQEFARQRSVHLKKPDKGEISRRIEQGRTEVPS